MFSWHFLVHEPVLIYQYSHSTSSLMPSYMNLHFYLWSRVQNHAWHRKYDMQYLIQGTKSWETLKLNKSQWNDWASFTCYNEIVRSYWWSSDFFCCWIHYNMMKRCKANQALFVSSYVFKYIIFSFYLFTYSFVS